MPKKSPPPEKSAARGSAPNFKAMGTKGGGLYWTQHLVQCEYLAYTLRQKCLGIDGYGVLTTQEENDLRKLLDKLSHGSTKLLEQFLDREGIKP